LKVKIMAKTKKVYLLESVVIGKGDAAVTLEPGRAHSLDGDVADSLLKSGAARKPQGDADADSAPVANTGTRNPAGTGADAGTGTGADGGTGANA
jgi:hypothetical protein